MSGNFGALALYTKGGNIMKASILLAFFALCLFAGTSSAQTSANGKVFWRGTIDDKVHLVVTGRTVEARPIAGKPSTDGRYSFTAPLPQRAVNVSVNTKEGRSRATVIQQPAAENNFTAIIEVYDDRGGDDDYLLDIYW